MKTSRLFPTAFFPNVYFQTVPVWARCVLVSWVVTGGSIQLEAATETMPRRPAAAFANYNGKMELIVGASNNRPIVMDDDRRVTVAETSSVGLNVGRTFAAGRVEIRNPEALGWTMTYTMNNVAFSQRPLSTQFKATLVSDTNLQDVFVVTLVFDARETFDEPVVSRILVSEVGRLAAGKPKRFSSQFPPMQDERQWAWIALVFSGGLEVRTSGVPDRLSQFFDAAERYRHIQRMQQRAHGTDAAIEVYRQFPLKLPEDLRAVYAGQTVQARLTVNPKGSVSELELVDLKDPKLAGELRAQFGWWLFFPAIKNGLAVERQAIMPLRL